MASGSFFKMIAQFVLVTITLFGIGPTASADTDAPVNVKRVLDDLVRILDTYQGSHFDISELEDLFDKVKQSRRQEHCGERIRKEVRMMSRDEWEAYTNAINSLKSKGIYDQVAAIHRNSISSTRLYSAHFGPNFLGWHRIYLLFYEDLLRIENPCVTIPYWDSSLDHAMSDPRLSVVWSDNFFGNGDNEVQTGPFANWITSFNDSLIRDIGNWGSLISTSAIRQVLTKTKHSEIINLNDCAYCIESHHNSVHNWVGGQMNDLEKAAEDPVFFMHHAFIDCFWRLFQEKNGLEDAFKDYPDYNPNPNPNPNQDNDLHKPKRRMDPFADLKPFKGITNRDGYRYKYYNMTKCAARPTCSYPDYDCGSPHLICERGICVSKAIKAPVTFKANPRPVLRQGIRFITQIIDPRTVSDTLRGAALYHC